MERADEETAAHRAELIMEIQAGIMDAYNQSRIGKTVKSLVRGISEEKRPLLRPQLRRIPGYRRNHIFQRKEIEPGNFYDVTLTKDLDGDMYGEK